MHLIATYTSETVLVKPFTAIFQDADGNEFPISISYEYQFNENEQKEILQCVFDPMPPYKYPDQELIESTKNYIEFIEKFENGGYYVVWNVEPVKYEPKY